MEQNPTSRPTASDPEPLMISPAGVRRLLARGERVTVLDARGRGIYARSTERVAGDLRVPMPARDLSGLFPLLRRDDWLIVYCT